jgi:hypothetical protein
VISRLLTNPLLLLPQVLREGSIRRAANMLVKFPPFFGQVAKRKKSEDNLLSEDGRHCMSRKRKKHTEETKARVALEAIKGVRTLSELSAVYAECTPL